MSNIKEALDSVKEPIEVEIKSKKVKKEISERQKETLKKAQDKRKQNLEEKREAIKKGEVEEKQERESIKIQLRKLDQLDELVKKLTNKEETKPIDVLNKEVEKPKEIINEQPQEKLIEPNPIKVEDTVVKEKELLKPEANLNNYNMKKRITTGSIKNDYKIPILGKKSNPFIDAFRGKI